MRELENILERACALAENQTIDLDDLNLRTPSQSKNEDANFMPGDEPIENYLERTEKQAHRYTGLVTTPRHKSTDSTQILSARMVLQRG